VTSVPFEEALSLVIPCTGDTSSPDVSLGNALILVHTSRYELGAPRPKFSGRQAVTVISSSFRTLFVYVFIH